MIELAEELRRLSPATSDEALPPVPDVVQVDVRCQSDAPAVLDRARGLLGLAIRHRLEHTPDDESASEPDPVTVDEAYGAAVLPPWFLDRTPFASAARTVSGWTVESWLYWFLSAHEDRAWRWVSASVVSPTRIAVVIQVADLPLAWEALRWAVLAAGATSAEL
jgi:hypothetical protein